MALALDPQLNLPERCSEFLTSLLDTVAHQLVVIDKHGEIQFVNKRWLIFGEHNGCTINDWSQVNYLDECRKAASQGDEYGQRVNTGICRVIEGKDLSFYLEYPCNSPTETRWFMMWVNPFLVRDKTYYVISHHDITQRKTAEEEVFALAKLDALTSLPNRRALDEFLDEEWKRCVRQEKSLSYAILDIDHFKLVNDTYGHHRGDEYLQKIANTLTQFCKRPSDICGRYGGEEFVIIWGEADLEEAQLLSNKLLKAISDLNLINESSPVKPSLTVSIGLATILPSKNADPLALIKKADQLLYKAKKAGRNRIEIIDMNSDNF